MRCLYCGKELALFKRLTKGSEFCSEAHRTKYQEEFNDLALNRLLQSRSAGEAEATPPQPLVEEEEPELAELEPVAKAIPIATPPREVKTSPKPPLPAAKRAPVIPAAKAKPAAKPQAREEVVGMTGWILVSPELQPPEPAEIVGGEPPMFDDADTDPVLPWRAVKVQEVAREYGLKWANPVTWNPPVESTSAPVRPVERNVEVRDFSRQAPSPVLQQQERDTQHSQQIAPSGAVGEAMDITNQPCRPADPVLWQAGPQPASALEPVLGEFARLDFPTTGFEASSTNSRPAPSIPISAPAPLPQPSAAAPPPVPVPAIVEPVPPAAPSAAAPAPPATQPLPLTLQGVSAGAAKPTLVGKALATATQPQTPLPTALPLRPAVVLGPAVPAAQPQPKPAPAPSQTNVAQPKPPTTAPQLRQTSGPPVIKPVAPTQTAPPQAPPQQASKPAVEAAKTQSNPPSNKVKRPEVRIIPTAPTQTAPAPQAATPKPVAVPPPAQQAPPQAAPKPVAQPAAKAPVPIATARPAPQPQPRTAPQPQVKPEPKAVQAKAEVQPLPEPKPEPKAEPKPEPKAAAKHVGPRSTLITSDVAETSTPASGSKPVDLGLPELHAVEEGGFWAKVPGGVKIAVAGVLVLAIFGFAFMTLNGNSATAKVAAKGTVYELGRQMNTTGWIENWTPGDKTRRVTLLRGSQNSVDYRMQFNAQIQSQAVGWMFRGLNPRNFYVAKIERNNKTGADFGVNFVRYAVIDGRAEGRTEKPLEVKGLHVGTIYQIKFEAIGSNFKVWVQNNLVDEWNDKRLGSGGLGLYSEKDEVGIIQGDVSAYELVAKDAK